MVGQIYVVTFDMAGNPEGGGPSIKEMNVSAGDNSQDYLFDTTGATFESMNWLSQIFSFTATSTTTTLTFLAVSPGDAFGAALDNVAVNPIPEPSTVLLLGSGLTGLVLFRRHRA